MPRSTAPLLQRVRARTRVRRAALRVVCLLIFALIGAPASSALRHECDLCPRTCPMHLARAQQGGSAHLGCHGTPTDPAHHHQSASHERAPSVARPTCGNHAVLPGTVLPPMLLPAVHVVTIAIGARRVPRRVAADYERSADPPDTPPPIDAA